MHNTAYMLFLLQINGSEKQVCRELHIAYRYGDHYDSVRRIGDNSESPAQLRIEVWCPSRSVYRNSSHLVYLFIRQDFTQSSASVRLMFVIIVTRICRIHMANSVSLRTVRKTGRKSLLLQRQRTTTWFWAPSRVEGSKVRSHIRLIRCCQGKREIIDHIITQHLTVIVYMTLTDTDLILSVRVSLLL